MHSRDILHRDLKPQNILVFRDDSANGSNDTSIKITDFGLSRPTGCLYSKGLTRQAYTLWYRPIELLVNDLDTYHISADLWSIGCVLYELFVGTPLFSGRDESDMIGQIIRTLGNNTAELATLGSEELMTIADDMALYHLRREIFNRMKEPEVESYVLALLRYSTELQSDFDGLTGSGFLSQWNYPTNASALPSEYGSVYNIRILTSSEAPVARGVSANGNDVYYNPVLGKQGVTHINQDGDSMQLIYRDPYYSGMLAQNATLAVRFSQAQAITQDTAVRNLLCTRLSNLGV